jgi:hypothetical protein
MSSAAIARVLGFGILLLLLGAHPAKAQQQPGWTWRDQSGQSQTRAKLDILLRIGITSQLERADLRRAYLWGANLRRAYLWGTNLSGANLLAADLSDAALIEADLDGANLVTAHLDGVRLDRASLRNANLRYAELRHADLRDAELSAAFLGGAKLDGAIFEPKSLPELSGFAAANGLELLTYASNPTALVQLRKQLEDGGFREQERKITFALKRREAQLSWAGCTARRLPEYNAFREPVGPNGPPRAILWSSDSNFANCGSFILNTVFFDFTCQYGMSPGRPLILGVLFWILCAVLYFACLHTSGETGLYRVYSQSITEDPSPHRRAERILPPAGGQTRGTRRFLQFFSREWLLLRTSMFFSLMSAFNIGFRDIDFGRWLRLLTQQEFDIKAVGWARVVAGWQSLVSVYLIALWVLTYFSRPFH